MKNYNMIEEDSLHIFDNGVKVFKKHLIPLQLERYKILNLHEPEEEEWFKKIMPVLAKKSNPIFIDIGSAIGYYSILMRVNVPHCQIICYEPLKLHREYFFENWNLNRLNADRLFVENKAIYSKNEKLLFKEQLYGSHILRKKKELKERLKEFFLKPKEYKINAVTLDAEITHHGLIDLVKIDVQGAEIEVLKGSFLSLKNKLVKCWIIGTHTEAIHRECLTILQRFNYRIVFENIDTKTQPDGIIISSTMDFSIA